MQGDPLDPLDSLEVVSRSRRQARPGSRRGMLLVLGILAFGAAFAGLGYVLVKSIVARREEAKQRAVEGAEKR